MEDHNDRDHGHDGDDHDYGHDGDDRGRGRGHGHDHDHGDDDGLYHGRRLLQREQIKPIFSSYMVIYKQLYKQHAYIPN